MLFRSLGRLFCVVGGEDGVTRVKVGEGVREERTKIDGLSLFVFGVNDLTYHEQITNRTKIVLDISAYKSNNKIKMGII